MRVVVVTSPEPVIGLADALEHLKVDGGDEDALIQGMVASATAHAEEFTQRAIGPRVLEARFDAFEACGPLRLRHPPVIELVSIAWRRADREMVTGDLADVECDDREVYAVSGTAPWEGLHVGRNALRVRYKAGYETVPDNIRSAILVMTSFLYHNRGAQTAEPPAAIAALLRPFRVYA